MSKNDDTPGDGSNSNHEKHETIANAFGRTTDPLAEYADTFERLDVDPFEMFLDERIRPKDYADETISNQETRIRQWKEWMAEQGRHPACPHADHVLDFANYHLNERGLSRSEVGSKLGILTRAYGYFQDEPDFPHDTEFNPIKAARGKLDLMRGDPDDPRPMTLDDVREVLGGVKHVRDRAMIMAQFKLMLRGSELCNIKLSEIHIANSDLLDHYPEMGSHPLLDGRPNAVYIPPDREHNKSERPKVLPLDDELRSVILRYLLVRPDVDEPWLFLSKTKHKKLNHTIVNDVWHEHFRPEWGPTDRYRGVSSHYGRHFGTTWFKVKREWDRPKVKYLRGDKQGGGEIRSTRDALDSYVHTYYEDIEDAYRAEVFKLRL